MKQLVLYTIELRPCGSKQWSAQGFTLERGAALKTALDLWLKSNPSQPYSSDVRVTAKSVDLSGSAPASSHASVLMDFCCPHIDTSASFAGGETSGSDYDYDMHALHADAPADEKKTSVNHYPLRANEKTGDDIFSIDIDSFRPLENPAYDPQSTSRTSDVRPSGSRKADKWLRPDGSIDSDLLMNYLRHGIDQRPLRFPTEQYRNGVFLAAEHLISQLNENPFDSSEVFSSFARFREHVLFGASSWGNYAWGGCWFIGDQTIAETFLNDLQLSFVDDEYRLHSHQGKEHVIDIMAGALSTACNLLAYALVEGFGYDDIIWF